MRSPRFGIVVILSILLLLPLELAWLAVGSEPYPGLYMPSFAGVPVKGDDVTASRLTLTAQTAEGPIDIDPVGLMPNETRLAESIAGQFFADESRVREVAKNGWLYDRLQAQGVTASGMEVRRERLLIDPSGRGGSRTELLDSYTVDIEVHR